MKYLTENDLVSFLKSYESYRTHHYDVFFAYTVRLTFIQQLVKEDPSQLGIFKNTQAVQDLVEKQAMAYNMARRASTGWQAAMINANIWDDAMIDDDTWYDSMRTWREF